MNRRRRLYSILAQPRRFRKRLLESRREAAPNELPNSAALPTGCAHARQAVFGELVEPSAQRSRRDRPQSFVP